MHRIIKNNESSILPLFSNSTHENFTNVGLFCLLLTLGVSLCVSLEMGRILNSHTLFIHFEMEKQMIQFLEKSEK